MEWVHIGNIQRKCASHYKTKTILSPGDYFTRLYSRVRVRTLATPRLCTCASLTGVQFICTAEYLGQAKCVHKVTTDFILTPLPSNAKAYSCFQGYCFCAYSYFMYPIHCLIPLLHNVSKKILVVI
jgi:hypothetical protein